MNSSAASLEANFIHERFHQVDSTPVGELDVLRGGGIRGCAVLEPLPFVANGEENFAIEAAAAADLNTLVRILAVSVNHGVRQGLTQRDFNVNFTSVCVSKLVDEDHELICEGGNCRHFTWQRLPELHIGAALGSAGQNGERMCLDHDFGPHLVLPRHALNRKQGSCQAHATPSD